MKLNKSKIFYLYVYPFGTDNAKNKIGLTYISGRFPPDKIELNDLEDLTYEEIGHLMGGN